MKKTIASTLSALALAAVLPAAPAHAGGDPYVGEISWFAGNFAPVGWAFCDGQLQAISQNNALFSIVGTIYGGDGVTTFGLPDMRGRVPVHAGQGPGLSNRQLGSKFGTETNTLTLAQLPPHSHSASVRASTAAADFNSPAGLTLGAANIYSTTGNPTATLAANTIALASAGGNQPENNMAPSLGVHCIISLFGTYPSRN